MDQSRKVFIYLTILIVGVLVGVLIGGIIGNSLYEGSEKEEAPVNKTAGEITLTNHRDGAPSETYTLNCETEVDTCLEVLQLDRKFERGVACTLIGPTVIYEFEGTFEGEDIKLRGDNANACYSEVAAIGEEIRAKVSADVTADASTSTDS